MLSSLKFAKLKAYILDYLLFAKCIKMLTKRKINIKKIDIISRQDSAE